MADWQRTVMLNPEWDQAQSGEIGPSTLAQSIARKLMALKPSRVEWVNEELAEIIENFEAAGADLETTADDIDELMRALYDWGDTSLDADWNGKKVCWIDTISRVRSPVVTAPSNEGAVIP